MRTEPFQIFSLRHRPELARQNPSLSSSELTSALGSMWRSLTFQARQEYLQMASSVATKGKDVRKRRPKPPTFDVPPNGPVPDAWVAHVSVKIEECPLLSIVPRGQSGVLAAMASAQIVSHEHTKTDSVCLVGHTPANITDRVAVFPDDFPRTYKLHDEISE
jgi:hypothetical protein